MTDTQSALSVHFNINGLSLHCYGMLQELDKMKDAHKKSKAEADNEHQKVCLIDTVLIVCQTAMFNLMQYRCYRANQLAL